MAERFCGNCGNALSDDDRYCPNCGRAVDETASVPTPEADVPPPPPPQTGWQRFREGWQGTGQEGTRFSEPPRPQNEPRPFLYQSCLNSGCAIILAIILAVVIIFGFLALVGSIGG
jgi:hypothetical protein